MWSILASAGLIASMLAMGAAAPAQAVGRTQVSVIGTESDGVTPMANAEVDVFYEQTNPPDTYSAPLMATATADSSGLATLTLDTSMVSDLGDIGDGNQTAFSVEIVEFGRLGEEADTDAILALGSTTPVTLSQDLNAFVTDNPDCTGPCAKRTLEATATNYHPCSRRAAGPGWTPSSVTAEPRRSSARRRPTSWFPLMGPPPGRWAP
jgi:hypothetical protein